MSDIFLFGLGFIVHRLKAYDNSSDRMLGVVVAEHVGATVSTCVIFATTLVGAFAPLIQSSVDSEQYP